MDIHALFSLKGKTAVVTGASGALGGAAVRAMAYAGANVAACYNSSRERLDTLISETSDAGVEIKPYKVNSFSQDEIRQHAEDVMQRFRRDRRGDQHGRAATSRARITRTSRAFSISTHSRSSIR